MTVALVTCPECGTGTLGRCPGAPGWTRCTACSVTFDRQGHAYDRDWRPMGRRRDAP